MKCVVVGNSCSALCGEYGKTIESTDIVIRCNNFVTTRFERFVGFRTDIWFLSILAKKSFRTLPSVIHGNSPEYVRYFFKEHDGFWFVPECKKICVRSNLSHKNTKQTLQKITTPIPLPNVEFFPNEILMDVSSRVFCPSTGLLAIFYAMRFFGYGNVSVVGFKSTKDIPRWRSFGGLENFYVYNDATEHARYYEMAVSVGEHYTTHNYAVEWSIIKYLYETDKIRIL